jgi:hypothetical protein
MTDDVCSESPMLRFVEGIVFTCVIEDDALTMGPRDRLGLELCFGS